MPTAKNTTSAPISSVGHNEGFDRAAMTAPPAPGHLEHHRCPRTNNFDTFGAEQQQQRQQVANKVPSPAGSDASYDEDITIETTTTVITRHTTTHHDHSDVLPHDAHHKVD